MGYKKDEKKFKLKKRPWAVQNTDTVVQLLVQNCDILQTTFAIFSTIK